MAYFVYLLESVDHKNTYVGATVDLDRRLRQHNGVIKGGAKLTTSRLGVWSRVMYVSGFPTWKSALQFEWRWKNITRRVGGGSPLVRRICALSKLLSLDRSTSNALPYVLWEVPPHIHFTSQEHLDIYNEFAGIKVSCKV